jgi:hypothetical protein
MTKIWCFAAEPPSGEFSHGVPSARCSRREVTDRPILRAATDTAATRPRPADGQARVDRAEARRGLDRYEAAARVKRTRECPASLNAFRNAKKAKGGPPSDDEAGALINR